MPVGIPICAPPLKVLQQAAFIVVHVPMRVPPQKGLESSSQIKFFFLGWQAAHRIGIVGVPMRVPPSRHSSGASQCASSTERSRKFFSKRFFFFGNQAASRNSLESSSGSRQQALDIAARIPMGLPSTERSRKFFWKQAASTRHSSAHPNRRPSTERSRKFFSNKVFLLGVACSTQNRHSRLPKWASLHRKV